MTRMPLFALLTAALWAALAQAAPGDALVARIKELRPDLPVATVQQTELEGILALELEDGAVLYGTSDARFLFTGDMYELRDPGLVNLTESIRDKRRQALIAGVRTDQVIVFSPEGEPRTRIHVFTDVDCGYCRKLHQEIADINDLGIEVRYLAYPRAGVDSASYDKIVSAWCAVDRQRALTKLKQGEEVPSRSCPNPVARQLELGRQIGIRGTPALVTEGGRLLSGYLPPPQLAEALGL